MNVMDLTKKKALVNVFKANKKLINEIISDDVPDSLLELLIEDHLKDADIQDIQLSIEHQRLLLTSKLLNDITDSNFVKPNYQEVVEEKSDQFVDTMRVGHRNIDLHGYTERGARQSARRLILSIDRERPNVIRFNVGKGLHSKNAPVLPGVITGACKELGMPEPFQNKKNAGYLILNVPLQNDS